MLPGVQVVPSRQVLLAVVAGITGAVLMAIGPIATVSTATADDVRPLSEAEFLARFEQWEPKLEELKAQVEGTLAEVRAAKALPNPTLSYNREEIFPREGSLPENYAILGLPLDISGRRSRRIDAAEAGAEATRGEVERQRFVLSLDALEVYYDAAAARMHAETLRDGRAALASLGERMAARTAAGDASGYDRGRLEIELGAYADLVAEAETTLGVARRRLGQLIGDREATYDAADPLAIPTPPASLADLRNHAVEGRPDHQAARQRLEQAEYELSAARRAWVPSLTLSGGWKSSDTGTETGNGYVAGLGMTLPLFDQGQAERQAALAHRREAEARLRSVAWQASAAVENAYHELVQRVERASQFEEGQLPRLEQLVRRANISYREGEESVFGVLDAHRTARDIRSRGVELRREAKRSEVDLWRAVGRRP